MAYPPFSVDIAASSRFGRKVIRLPRSRGDTRTSACRRFEPYIAHANLPRRCSRLARAALFPNLRQEIQRVDQESFVLLLVGVRPFFPSPFPRKFAAFFAFGPLVLPDLFFDEVGDPVKWIGVHHGRDRYVFFNLQNFAHLDPINHSLSCSVNPWPRLLARNEEFNCRIRCSGLDTNFLLEIENTACGEFSRSGRSSY